jgi:hypothetical protein
MRFTAARDEYMNLGKEHTLSLFEWRSSEEAHLNSIQDQEHVAGSSISLFVGLEPSQLFHRVRILQRTNVATTTITGVPSGWEVEEYAGLISHRCNASCLIAILRLPQSKGWVEEFNLHSQIYILCNHSFRYATSPAPQR